MSSLILLPVVDESMVKNQFIIEKKLSDIVSDKIDEILGNAFECTEDGDVSAALRLYDLVLKKEPSNIRALVDKGATLQNMGKIKLADKFDPAGMEALERLGCLVHAHPDITVDTLASLVFVPSP